MTNHSETSFIYSDRFFPVQKSKPNATGFAIKGTAKAVKVIFPNTTFPISGILKNILKAIFYKPGFQKGMCLVAILVLLFISSAKAQPGISYALHANIIYRFTKYIEWPYDNKKGDFIIGVVGDTELYDELEHFVENKTAGGKKIVIRKMSSSADSYYCQILFISEDKSRYLKKIAEITKGTPTLIVSESDGLASKGSCINFVIVNERLKLEINKNNILQHNLNIANELLSLGSIVK